MKKYLFLVMVSFFLVNCSSDDSGSSTITSNIKIDAVNFVPNKLTVSDASNEQEGSLVFALTKSSTQESIVVKINYPLNSSSAPNGTYDFGIGETGTMLFAQGSYTKNNKFYSLAGYTVKVTKTGENNKFKLEFQNVQAVEINTANMILITGSCEGTFN